MDAFEQIIGQLLEEETFWVRHEVKINLSSDEKKQIGKPTTPRIEIDIVALDISKNKIYLLEVKSFLDSNGVNIRDIMVEQEQQEGRYKLLTSANYRKIITNRLREEFISSGHINNDTTVSYGLIAGLVAQKNENKLVDYFKSKDWLFWGPTKVKEKINKLATKGYENNAVTIAAKILMR